MLIAIKMTTDIFSQHKKYNSYAIVKNRRFSLLTFNLLYELDRLQISTYNTHVYFSNVF